MRCAGRILNRYVGCTGGVKGLECCDRGVETMLASCCLDRYLRVYTLEPPKLLHKVSRSAAVLHPMIIFVQVYLKLLPNRLLFNWSQTLVGLDLGRANAEFWVCDSLVHFLKDCFNFTNLAQFGRNCSIDLNLELAWYFWRGLCL